MHNKRILTGLGFVIVMAMPACGGQFVPLGKDDAGVGASTGVGGGSSTVGGAASVTCKYNGVTYAPNVSFKSADGCNTCSCTSSGQVVCTEMACQVNGGASSIGGGSAVNGGASPVGCVYDGVTYAVGASFKSTDGCNTCGCSSDGSVACTLLWCANGGASGVAGGSAVNGGAVGATCVYNNQTYAVGTSFKSTDGCNTCSCTANGVACTEMACAAGGATGVAGGSSVGCGPINLPAITCTGYKLTYDPTTGCANGFVCPQDAGTCACTGPSPASPTVLCSDGSTGGPYCEQFTDGTCNWAVRACPVNAGTCNCTGAKPTYLVKCPDGTIVGPTCGATSSGACDWVSPGCPTTGSGGGSSVGGATSCPAIPLVMPLCDADAGMVAKMQYDSAGCPKGYACEAVNTSCPSTGPIAYPSCDTGYTAQLQYDSAGCATKYICVAVIN